MGATDQILAAYIAEIEDRQQFINGILESANGEDLTEEKTELIDRASARISAINERMKPLEEALRISGESSERISQLARYMSQKPAETGPVEYRSAGAFVIDRWRAGTGDEEATKRLIVYQRAAAHQTTADNPGLLPEPIIQPVVNFVDAARPLVSALGPRQLPSGTWSRPKVTQHTLVAAQSAEKAELSSQKMTITALPVTAVTYGGYVNVSKQNQAWSDPQVMDIVIGDLAAQYAVVTENVAVDAFVAGATAATTNLATGANTAEQVAAAIWGAAGQVYAGTKGQGRVIAAAPPQMLGLIGPLFAPVNPVDAQSSGFSASQFGQGANASISGIPVYVTAAMADNTILVLSTAAAEVYEDRIGSLQVIEPSVLGVQVAYAGFFAPLIIEATGIIKITKTP